MKRRNFLALAGLITPVLSSQANDRNKRQDLPPMGKSKLGRVIAQGQARGSFSRGEDLMDKSEGCTQNIVTQNTQKVGRSTSVIYIDGDLYNWCGK